jgi:hypothetical protein
MQPPRNESLPHRGCLFVYGYEQLRGVERAGKGVWILKMLHYKLRTLLIVLADKTKCGPNPHFENVN